MLYRPDKGLRSWKIKSLNTVIRTLNPRNKTAIKTNNEMSKYAPLKSIIRQGDSLSQNLFHLIMDWIIEVKNCFRLSREQIVCYADYAVIKAENED